VRVIPQYTQEAAMATTIRFPRTMLLASSAAMLVSATGLAAAQATTPTGWRVGATISISGENIDLHSVAAVAAADAWAVGSATGKVTGESTPIVVHWNGRHWLRVSLPARILRVIGPSDTVSVIGARSGRGALQRALLARRIPARHADPGLV